jgi:hypothetical protein
MLSCPGLHRPEIEFFDSVLVTFVGYYEILGRHAVLKLALSLSLLPMLSKLCSVNERGANSFIVIVIECFRVYVLSSYPNISYYRSGERIASRNNQVLKVKT